MTSIFDNDKSHISNKIEMPISYRPNPFSPGHIDKTVIEGSSISQMIEEIGLGPITRVHDGVFVYVGDVIN